MIRETQSVSTTDSCFAEHSSYNFGGKAGETSLIIAKKL
jgi:hypothetical protein